MLNFNKYTVTSFIKSLVLIALFSISSVWAKPELKENAIRTKLNALGMQIGHIEWIEKIKMYEVQSQNSVIYIQGDGSNFFVGNWYQLNKSKPVNKTKIRKAQRNMPLLRAVAKKDMIVYSAVGKEKEAIYVFTDPNCPYCTKFHKQIPKLNKAGISVYYLALPIITKNSKQDSINIWCAKDRKKAMSIAKDGGSLPKKNCINPIEEHMALGIKIGASGTPFLVFKSNGQAFNGYVPADKLIAAVNKGRK